MKQEKIPRYLLAEDFEVRSEELSMRRCIWTVASSIAELRLETSFRDFSESLSLSESDVSSAILDLLSHRLIHENLSFDESSPVPVKTVRELLKGTSSTLALGISGDEDPTNPIPEAAVSPTAIHTRLGEFPKMKRQDSTVVGWISGENESTPTVPDRSIKAGVVKTMSLKPSPIARTAKLPDRRRRTSGGTEKKRFKLQPIISQIEKLSKGGIEGSVLAYQVFLKVPAKLLRDEGIESFHLVDANTEFTNQRLCQAIIRATTEITGYNLKIEGYNKSESLNLIESP
ncbi:MAG: hypothetical protein ACRCXD_19085 [Luteolibacter sp.]